MKSLTTAHATLIVLIALLQASCTVSPYQHDFISETANFTASPPTPIGPWQGSWNSDVTGHHGPLWCIISRANDGKNRYDFRYRAGWGFFRFGDYTHTIRAPRAPDGSLIVTGSMVLPHGLGTYQVNGTVSKNQFQTRYHSATDHGSMTLHRPMRPQSPQ